MAVPLSQLTAIDPDEPTPAEAIKDWHYWVAQGYLLLDLRCIPRKLAYDSFANE